MPRPADFASIRVGDVVEGGGGERRVIAGFTTEGNFTCVDVVEYNPVKTWYGERSWNRWAAHARIVEEEEDDERA